MENLSNLFESKDVFVSSQLDVILWQFVGKINT